MKALNTDSLKQHFVSVMGAGTGLIIICQFVFGAAWLGVLCCVMLMIVYGVVFVRVEHQSEQLTDLFADSLYYLGFLFTIVSLVSALLVFGNQDQLSSDDVLWQFGLALVTTALGLGGRTYFGHFAARSDDPEQLARDTLLAASASYSQELTASAGLIKKARVDLEKDLDGIGSKLAQDFANIADEGKKALVATFDTLEDQLVDEGEKHIVRMTDKVAAAGATRLNAIMEQLDENLGQEAARFRQSADALSAAVAPLKQLAESLQKGATSLEHLDLSASEEFVLQAKTAGEGMRASVEGIQAAGTVISATLDVADKLRQSVDALPNLQEPLADVSNTLTGVSADIRNFGKALQAPDAAMEKLAKFLQDLVTNSDEYLGQTDDLSARAKQHLQTIGALQADMEAQAQKALDAQAAMNKALVDSAVLIRKELS